MAWAAKGFDYSNYATLSAMLGGDIEGMSPSIRKAYLQQRLRLLERQIQTLADRMGFDPRALKGGRARSPRPLQGGGWTSLADLGYLLAARDAVLQALAAL